MDGETLLAELGGAIADLRVAERDDPKVRLWLEREGFTIRARDMAGGVGFAEARLDRQRDMWLPEEDGTRVLVLGCWDGPAYVFDAPHRHDAPLIDLIAWSPREPRRLYRRTGDGAVVGIEGVSLALETRERLRVFQSPGDFIRHGGERGSEAFAAVIIDPAATFWTLEGVVEVVCDDVAHAEQVQALLAAQAPPVPRLAVPASCLERVA